MLYPALRGVARIALRWYYGDVLVQGAEHVPRHAPLLLVANHPNALVDALAVATAMPRRIRLTAKATLFANPVLAAFLQLAGVVPLRRAQDARVTGGGSDRNNESFRVVTDTLRRGRAVLVFPEGISHDQPSLAPLKSGAARMAMAARAAGTAGLALLPVGLVYEEKERAGSRVLVRFGEPLWLDEWAGHADDGIAQLTAVLDAQLHLLTLNFATDERARRAIRLAASLVALVAEPPELAHPRSLAAEADIASRIERATTALERADTNVNARVDQFLARVTSLQERLRARHIPLGEARISTRRRAGAQFVMRELTLAALALPVALLGRAVHWLPVRVARTLAMHSIGNDPSRDQPAMRTIVLGLVLILSVYAVIAITLVVRVGPLVASGVLVLLILAAQTDVALSARLRRARIRAQAFLSLRRDPSFRQAVLAEVQSLEREAIQLDELLVTRD